MTAILKQKAIFGNPMPSMEVHLITPEIARDWLDRNTGNRPFKPGKIAEYATAIESGEWKLTGDAIRFSSTGKLIDGQNRLQAIVNAGKAVQSVVMMGLGDDIFDVIDSGSPRSKSDTVFVKYQLPSAKSKLLSSTANIAVQFHLGQTAFKSKVINKDLLEFIDNNLDILDAVNYIQDNTPHESPVTKSIVTAFFFFAQRTDRPLAEQFVLRFMVGVVTGANDNLLHLRNACVSARNLRRQLQTTDIFGRLLLIWNSERRGRPIKYASNVRLRADEAYPKFI